MRFGKIVWKAILQTPQVRQTQQKMQKKKFSGNKRKAIAVVRSRPVSVTWLSWFFNHKSEIINSTRTFR